MISIILIDKSGTIKESHVKSVTKEDLYKKCSCKNPNEFKKRTTWKVNVDNEKVVVELWARESGRANMENKYDFPPPVDSVLYFGTCALVRINENNDIIELTSKLWKKMYEHLFGGFDDIENEDEDIDEEDELKDIPKEMKTKGGYLKDGFVVDTNSEEDIVSVSDEEEDFEGDSGKESDDETGSELEEAEYNYTDED